MVDKIEMSKYRPFREIFAVSLNWLFEDNGFEDLSDGVASS